MLARPDGELFQIPSQLLRLDRPERRDEPPAPFTGNFTLPRRGRLIDEPGESRGAADAVLLVELQVGELEDELFQRLGLRLRGDGHVGREPLPHCDEDRIQCRVDPTGVAAHGNVNRLLPEEFFQHPELGAVQGQRDYRKLVPPTLFPPKKERQKPMQEIQATPPLLHCECIAQLFAYPLRLQRRRADHDRVGRRLLDGSLNLRPKQITAAQLARIDPSILPVRFERLWSSRTKASSCELCEMKSLLMVAPGPGAGILPSTFMLRRLAGKRLRRQSRGYTE